ncbi:hypothetical protein R1flu_006545 [Riccia fluitans]|uniref:Uncharacterized protein n=1 Tax=Riccia fluitans TaxID=41844 RepID=A0ABD1YWB7_9MARC
MVNSPWLAIAVVVGEIQYLRQGKYRPIAIVTVLVVEVLGVASQDERKNKKRKKNPDSHRIGLVHLRATINAIICHAWMKWFVLNVEGKNNYQDFYMPGTNKEVSCFCKQLYKLGKRAYNEPQADESQPPIPPLTSSTKLACNNLF